MMYLRRASARRPAVVERISAPPTLEISQSAMAKALVAGTAVTLTAVITDFVRYTDAWWLRDRDCWLRITDDALAADLDAFKSRLDGP
jgi:hypothetical protein